jgi:hypothetical protein
VVGIYRDQNDAGSIPTAFVLSLLLSVPLMAQTSASVGSEPDSVAAGRALFLGTVRFQNGAPPARRVTASRAWRFPKAARWGQTLRESIPKWVRRG